MTLKNPSKISLELFYKVVLTIGFILSQIICKGECKIFLKINFSNIESFYTYVVAFSK